jgi:hypothetical protein
MERGEAEARRPMVPSSYLNEMHHLYLNEITYNLVEK